MTLFEFVEHFDRDTKIVVIYYGSIEYRGMVGEITIENLRNREVVQGSVVMLDGEMCIPVNRIYPNRNADVILELREDLSEEDRLFIEQEIKKMMNKYGIERDGNFYYKIQNEAFDDFHSIISFYCMLSERKKYQKYIKGLGYVSHMEGTHKFVAWELE